MDAAVAVAVAAAAATETTRAPRRISDRIVTILKAMDSRIGVDIRAAEAEVAVAAVVADEVAESRVDGIREAEGNDIIKKIPLESDIFIKTKLK